MSSLCIQPKQAHATGCPLLCALCAHGSALCAGASVACQISTEGLQRAHQYIIQYGEQLAQRAAARTDLTVEVRHAIIRGGGRGHGGCGATATRSTAKRGPVHMAQA